MSLLNFFLSWNDLEKYILFIAINMPTYGGGKARLGRLIYHEIQKLAPHHQKTYFEPFCGLLGVARHIISPSEGPGGPEGRKIVLNDINKDLILMLKALQKGWLPPLRPPSRHTYEKLRLSTRHSALRGFVGIACAYSGIFFAGYRITDKHGHNFYKRTRDGILELRDLLLSENGKNITFTHRSYTSFHPRNQVIYCDPPYVDNTLKSEHFSHFDHEQFWKVMRAWSRHNTVIVSEYTAPPDFKMMWQKPFHSTYNHTAKKRVEKLFMIRSQSNK